ncbi:aminotransferase class I/II-fold pyridoxal phosphate-dependent enzyme [Frigidibacter albus]|uniref:Aminotransferase class I/II-fold pyridoxal phosphate-dependent enzyme n=1 Tax=Frigidibacter albus TaxID=1465486 RepID=A0A6L8VC59_9RHOB|nr:amino acid aminotransferase [Frigidibacter albus]MZQ87908.1 aminotransferase class I/II-fold pyridoxal phosphate-dependent enzyme [Frigidibacter albus]NBE29814.1 aminotransferase class I/II-fold pyridoxal phosphate-dependent enzyme [Frigidibacter albus]GGH42600.1 aromatic amino acid aminotransferase [Frigidibacter albus]
MLANLKPQAADKILALMGQFKADDRAGKIDLGVGVYKDASGLTPVMRAVKSAEQLLWQAETTKTYVALAGDPAFGAAMAGLILGPDYPGARLAAAATVGGTGAIRQALELIRLANPEATVWLSDPTWPNHPSIISYLGMKQATYRYFDAETRGVAFAAMIEDLGRVAPGDVVLLHGCCHNPTGANLTLPEWAEVAAVLERTGAIPLIDLAYQGFGDGLEADAAGTRLIAEALPEVLIAASCSKNFGIYRERTGVLLALAPDTGVRDLTQGTLAFLNRQNYSFPPDHGARLVTMILGDPALRAEWESELEEVRQTMLRLREDLARELRDRSGSDRFGFLAQHRGMFSRLGATPEQVERLRAEHGIYMVSDSRLNIAGLNARTVPVLAQAILDCGI